MAHRTLPILFINLGGEMMYILDQRLKAQAIDQEKAAKVMNDIVSTMFNRRFIEEIFKKHQPIHSRRVRHSRVKSEAERTNEAMAMSRDEGGHTAACLFTRIESLAQSI